MTKDNETTENEIKNLSVEEAFQKGFAIGLKKGRIEGMLAYQKKLVDNLQKDNAILHGKLAEII